MTDSFGIPQVTDYITQMGLKIAHINQAQELIELAFHGIHGQWRMIVGFQQSGDARKLMLIAPHMGSITTVKRLECLEALMAVNYRIAIGKFGLDLDDGEVRLEEALPLASDGITFVQFKLAFGALMQTVAMYQTLLPRIMYGNLSVQEALHVCEQEFDKGIGDSPQHATEPLPSVTPLPVELDVNDILAEVTRMFEEPTD